MAEATNGHGKFVWYDLMTTDLAKSKAFYGRLFPEWRFEEVPMGGFTYTMIKAGDTGLGGMVPLGAADGLPSHWVPYVSVASCDAAVKGFEAGGGKCCSPPMDVPGIGKFAVVTDAQGAVVSPFQFTKPMDVPAKPPAGHFCWNELLTGDPKAARELYTKVFGWEMESSNMGPGGTEYTAFKKDGAYVGGCMAMPAGAGAPPHWLSYVHVPDIEARFAQVEKLGGKNHTGIMTIPEVGPISVHADSNGASFALWAPPPAA